MRCNLHVHTIHSGKCTVPGLSRVCMETDTETHGVEVTNGHILASATKLAANFAARCGMSVIAGSDSHTLHGVGRTVEPEGKLLSLQAVEL